jgi:hypothetical protein
MPCPANSSGLKSADAAICARPCILKSVQVLADNTNAATVILYDSASAASGTVVAKVIVDATATYADFSSADGIVCNNGIYADVSGTGAEYIVHYELM